MRATGARNMRAFFATQKLARLLSISRTFKWWPKTPKNGHDLKIFSRNNVGKCCMNYCLDCSRFVIREKVSYARRTTTFFRSGSARNGVLQEPNPMVYSVWRCQPVDRYTLKINFDLFMTIILAYHFYRIFLHRLFTPQPFVDAARV